MPDIDPIQSFLGAFGQMQGLMQNRRRMKNEEAQQAALEQFRQKQLEQEAAKAGQEDLYKQAELEGKYGKRISNGLIQDIPGFQKPESEMDKLSVAIKNMQLQKGVQDIQEGRQKQSDKESALQVPGFKFQQGQRPTEKSAEELRKQSAAVNNIENLANELKADVGKGGMALLPSERKTKLQQKYTQLQLAMKEAADLGAISGPDMAIIQRSIPDPSAWGDAVVTRGAGRPEAYGTVLQDVKGRLGATAKARGYEPEQQQGLLSTQSAPQAQEKIINGAKYIKVQGGWKKAQ